MTLRLVATVLLIGSLLVIGAPKGLASEDPDSVAFEFPPAGPDENETAFLENVSQNLTLDPDYRVGTGTTHGGSLEEEGDAVRLRWTVRHPWGKEVRWDVQQNVSDQDESGNYLVNPTQLEKGVELWPDGSLIRITASPGELPSDRQANVTETSTTLASRMGIPVTENDTWTVANTSNPVLRLYQEVASRVPGVYLACDCVVAELNDPPYSKNLNRVSVYFTDDGVPVAIDTTPWVDLDRSNAIPPNQARENVSIQLEEQGYSVPELKLATVDLRFAEPALTYRFEPSGPGAHEFTAVIAWADTGEIQSIVGPESGLPADDDTSPGGAGEQDTSDIPTLPQGATWSLLLLAAWGFSRD